MPRHLTVLTGASRGMGLAMARQLLAPDRTLLCVSRHDNAALADEARARGATLIQWRQDLADTEGARQRLHDWLAAQDPATLASATLINNAGVIPHIGPLDTVPAEQLATALRVGLETPMQLTAAFLHATNTWVACRKAAVSGLGRRPMAAQAAYCAAKAGLDHFTRCVALEQAPLPHGARLVSLAPGVIDTDMQVQLRSGDPAAFPDRQRFVDLKAHGQLSTPDDAARQVLAWLDRPDFGREPVADVRQA